MNPTETFCFPFSNESIMVKVIFGAAVAYQLIIIVGPNKLQQASLISDKITDLSRQVEKLISDAGFDIGAIGHDF